MINAHLHVYLFPGSSIGSVRIPKSKSRQQKKCRLSPGYVTVLHQSIIVILTRIFESLCFQQTLKVDLIIRQEGHQEPFTLICHFNAAVVLLIALKAATMVLFSSI